MKIDKDLMDSLTLQAKASPRLRMTFDLRNSVADQSQRMLNAIEPGSQVPIHRHTKSSETVVVLRGSLREIYYDETGQKKMCVIDLAPKSENVAINIPKGQWHTASSLETGTVIMEIKDGT